MIKNALLSAKDVVNAMASIVTQMCVKEVNINEGKRTATGKPLYKKCRYTIRYQEYNSAN
jgi:hypothetical protein